MEIYKFGGASIKDADGVRNVLEVLKTKGYDNKLIVVSAMGKMTNAFEKIIAAYTKNQPYLKEHIKNVEDYHGQLLRQLFLSSDHSIFREVASEFELIKTFIKSNRDKNYDFVYDQIVSKAELISSKIISAYLTLNNVENTWIDVREFIHTNDEYRGAKVDWESTEENITQGIEKGTLYITQGFIASSEQGFTTTLGREGSDYSAGIFAYCLNAESLTIWKDVDGVLNADPRYFKETELLNQISYTEAIELAYYGASVIHPKTIQPLQKKEIPLYVKSFINPLNKGTTVSRGAKIEPLLPCFIVKQNQLLISISSLDFSFIVEQNLSDIFKIFHNFKMKVSLMQNSAISFSVCVEDKYHQKEDLMKALKKQYLVTLEDDVTLYTIRHFNLDALNKIEKINKVLLKQTTEETVQMVVR